MNKRILSKSDTKVKLSLTESGERGYAAADMPRFAGTEHCVIFICDMDEYYRSWDKLMAKGEKRIFPAHGKSFPVDVLKVDIGKSKREDPVLH